MLWCSRAVGIAASYVRSRLFATASFEARLCDCKALADNLQKIAEADRKFVTFEVHALNCDDVAAGDLGHPAGHRGYGRDVRYNCCALGDE